MRDDKPPSLRGALRRMNGVAFLFSTTGALFLLLPVYLQQIGNTPAQIGFVVGLMRVSMLLARPVAGRLLDRFGRRPVITWGGVVAGIAILSLFLFPQVGWTFLTFRVIQGAATALVDSGLGTVVADLAPAALRTRVFALYTVWLTLPGGIMPAVGEVVARRAGYLPLFGAAGGVGGGAHYIPPTARDPAGAIGTRADVVEPGADGAAGPGGRNDGWIRVRGLLRVCAGGADRGSAGTDRRLLLCLFRRAIWDAARQRDGACLAARRRFSPGIRLHGDRAGRAPVGQLRCAPGRGGAGAAWVTGRSCRSLYSMLLFGVPRERRSWAVASLAASFDTGIILSVGLGLVGVAAAIWGSSGCRRGPWRWAPRPATSSAGAEPSSKTNLTREISGTA
jgi:hypothetical protein